MDFFTGNNDLGTLGLGLVMAGVVSGLIAGLLGSGGGIIIVPVLYLVLGAAGVFESLRMHLAVGTALASLIPIAVAAWRTHSESVDGALAKRWLAPLSLGVAGGAVSAALLPGQALALAFAALALAMAAYLGFGAERWQLAGEPPRGMAGALLAFGFGCLSTLTAIGVTKPVLRLFGAPEPRACGTAAMFGSLITIGGALGAVLAGWQHSHLPMWSLGYVNLMALGILAPVSIGAWAVGTHIADAVDVKRLRPTVALLIAVVALKMAWDALG